MTIFPNLFICRPCYKTSLIYPLNNSCPHLNTLFHPPIIYFSNRFPSLYLSILDIQHITVPIIYDLICPNLTFTHSQNWECIRCSSTPVNNLHFCHSHYQLSPKQSMTKQAFTFHLNIKLICCCQVSISLQVQNLKANAQGHMRLHLVIENIFDLIKIKKTNFANDVTIFMLGHGLNGLSSPYC